MPYANLDERRAYHNEWHRKQISSNPSYKRAFQERKVRRRARRHKIVAAMISAFRANGCINCREEAECCLVAHHIDSTQKDFALGVARWSAHGRKRVLRELAKCVCLCANCHTKLHANVIKLPRRVLLVAAKQAAARVAEVEANATVEVERAVRAHHAGRKRRVNLEKSPRRNPARVPLRGTFNVPLALQGTAAPKSA